MANRGRGRERGGMLPYVRDACFADQGGGVCTFGKGVALDCSLPDSINVGRTAPIASGFAVRELGR
jgi:hypothetical protein